MPDRRSSKLPKCIARTKTTQDVLKKKRIAESWWPVSVSKRRAAARRTHATCESTPRFERIPHAGSAPIATRTWTRVTSRRRRMCKWDAENTRFSRFRRISLEAKPTAMCWITAVGRSASSAQGRDRQGMTRGIATGDGNAPAVLSRRRRTRSRSLGVGKCARDAAPDVPVIGAVRARSPRRTT